jgi:lipopolysaccharide transport system permease protein
VAAPQLEAVDRAVSAEAGAPAPDAGPPVTVIEPRRHGLAERLTELWRHRRLTRFFGSRALRKIYAKTVLGRSWLVLRPLATTVPPALIFGGVLKAPSDGLPYFLFFLAGMTAWTAFDRCLYWATRGIELNRSLLTRLYFPRLLLPVSSITPGLVEVALLGVVLALTMAWFGTFDGTFFLEVGPGLLAAVAALVLCLAFALGLGLWTSVLGARARDTRFSLQIVLSFWMLMTPVIYPLHAVPDRFRDVVAANPLTPLVEMFRWGLFGRGDVQPVSLAASVAVIAAVGLAGLWYFDRAEAASIDSM